MIMPPSSTAWVFLVVTFPQFALWATNMTSVSPTPCDICLLKCAGIRRFVVEKKIDQRGDYADNGYCDEADDRQKRTGAAAFFWFERPLP